MIFLGGWGMHMPQGICGGQRTTSTRKSVFTSHLVWDRVPLLHMATVLWGGVGFPGPSAVGTQGLASVSGFT